MSKKHNSHFIFILLGILVLVFVVFFGMRYFTSSYSFSDVDSSEMADIGGESETVIDYEPEPLFPPVVVPDGWQDYSNSFFSFSYPTSYQVLDLDSLSVVIMPYPAVDSICNELVDQAYLNCMQQQVLSPMITVSQTPALVNLDSIGLLEPKNSVMGPFSVQSAFETDELGMSSGHYTFDTGSQLMYVHYLQSNIIGNDYDFEILQSDLGQDQYALDEDQQRNLTEQIIQTIRPV